MVDDRTDVPTADIDWPTLLGRLAEVDGFAAMADVLYGSGVLIGDYSGHLSSDADFDDLIAEGDVMTLRALVTSLLRDDHFSPGEGDRHFWDGEFDEVLDAIADRLGLVYPLVSVDGVMPRRIPPCPTCGRIDMVKMRIVGFPAVAPDADMSRLIFAGCIPDEMSPPSGAHGAESTTTHRG